MLKVALALACVACMAHGRHARISNQHLERPENFVDAVPGAYSLAELKQSSGQASASGAASSFKALANLLVSLDTAGLAAGKIPGPAWTRGEIEAPAGTRDMGGWTMAFYTPEQQRRLQVDEKGQPRVDPAKKAPGPAWTRGEIEPPAGTRDMGRWTMKVYTPEQQQRLQVDEKGRRVDPAKKVPGPAWTRGEIERPAGTREMDGWTMAIYTPEQQQRLQVDETGQSRVEPAKEVPGPAWTRGEIEPPAGTRDMHGWTKKVYTPEQQQRLQVDETGQPEGDCTKQEIGQESHKGC